jgi:hypothetical protein
VVLAYFDFCILLDHITLQITVSTIHTLVCDWHSNRYCNGKSGHGKDSGDDRCKLHDEGLWYMSLTVWLVDNFAEMISPGDEGTFWNDDD